MITISNIVNYSQILTIYRSILAAIAMEIPFFIVSFCEKKIVQKSEK